MKSNFIKGPSTTNVRQMGRGGFEISDIPGRGREWFVKVLKKSKFQNFSELFKVKTRNYNRSRFQYESIHIFLFSKCNCIQYFKLYKNRNWAINFVLMSKN